MKFHSKRGERGIALFLALFALLLLSSVALGLMFMANTETAVNNSYRGLAQAYYAAQAGTQEGVMRLRKSGDTSYDIAGPADLPDKNKTTGVIYIINPTGKESIKPWDTADSANFDVELCNERFVDSSGNNRLGLTAAGNGLACGTAVGTTYYTKYDSKDPNTTTATAMPYKWVRITRKQNVTFDPYCVSGSCALPASGESPKVCWDGQHQVLLDLNNYFDCDQPKGTAKALTPVYVITALARTSNNARRMFQVEYAPQPPLGVPSAVTSKDDVKLNGNLQINGFDQCSCSCTDDGKGNIKCDNRGSQTCDKSKAAIFSGGIIDPSNASETLVSGFGVGDAANVAVTTWPKDYEVQPLIDRLKPIAVNVATDDGKGNWTLNSGTNVLGTLPNPFPPADPSNPVGAVGQVSYIGGTTDLKNGASGSGILIVDGDLTIHGNNFQWYGLIIVRGVLTMSGAGSVTTNIQGAILTGEQAKDNTTLGGSFGINLDVCAINNAFKTQPLSYISSRELLY